MEDNGQAVAQPEAGASEGDLLSRLEAHFGQAEEAPEPEQPEEEAPEASADTEDEQPAEEQEAAEADDPVIEIDGEQVPLSQVKAWKAGNMMQADYTRKTQEVASRAREVQQREQAALEQLQLVGAVSGEIGQLQALESQIKQYEGLNWFQLLNEDPIKMQELKLQHDALVKQRDDMRGRVNTAINQFQAQRFEAIKQRYQKTREFARTSLKGYDGKADDAMASMLDEMGYSPEEKVAFVTDPRLLTIAFEAYKYRALQASKPQVAKRVAEVPKTLKPKGGSGQSAEQVRSQQQRERFKKSGDIKDAVSLLERRFR